MISISAAQSAEQAQNYYKKENYYQKNSEKGYYHGNAAAVVGVKDGQEVDQDSFSKLLNLRHVDSGKKLNKGTRAGFDVTFSAPKSVSILVEGLEAIGQDNANKKAVAIRNAHEYAVKEAMKEVECLALTRIRDEASNVVDVPADGIVYASFQHDTARENAAGQIDPQLHTHNFVFNIVTYRDPKTGELKTGTIENKLIFRNKMYLGQLYRNALAKELQKLGYEIEVTDARHGFFEIKGFTKEQIEEFSGRSQDIREHLEEYRAKYPNASEAELLSIVTQSIKKQKGKIDRDAVRSNNFARMKAVGLDEKKLGSFAKEIEKLQTSKFDAANAIELAAKGITEQNSTFTKEEILREAMRIGLAKGLTKQELEEVLAKSDNILLLDKNVYTTIDVLEAERYVINQVRSSKTEAIDHDKKKRYEFLAKNFSTMTDGQKDMFNAILATNSQFVVVQGDAGTGKTFSMKAINDYISQYHADIEIVGLSFTGKAAAGLEEDSGIKSTTIHSFLAKEEAQTKPTKKRLIIVDEAGLAGSKQIAEIVKIAKKRGDRVVFVGDTKQFKAIAAGDLFADMQKYGAETIDLGETLRQKTALTKELVRLTKERDIDAIFSLLSKREKIVEQQEKEALFDQIRDEFRNKKGDLLVVASKNADRKALNDRLRDVWLNEFNLANQRYELGINEIVSLSGLDRFLAKNYDVGTMIQIAKLPGFKNGEIVEVIGYKDEHTLVVRNESGEKTIDLRKHADSLVVFRLAAKKFAAGDKIVFTKNWNEFKNGEIDIIENIDENGNIKLASGRSFNAKEYRYFDYGYAITDYKAQGVTANNVAVLADPNQATINSFYTQVTRAKEDVIIYTTNIDLLRTKIGSEATKSSTLNYVDINHLAKEEEHDNKRGDRAAHQRDGGGKRGDKRIKRKNRNNGKTQSRFEKFNYSSHQRDGLER